MMSESDDQKNRPAMFARLSSPTNPAAAPRRNHAGKHLLNHRRRLAEHADARGDVQAEHHPEQPELRRASIARSGGDVAGRHHAVRALASASIPRASIPARGTRTVNTPNIMNAK